MILVFLLYSLLYDALLLLVFLLINNPDPSQIVLADRILDIVGFKQVEEGLLRFY